MCRDLRCNAHFSLVCLSHNSFALLLFFSVCLYASGIASTSRAPGSLISRVCSFHIHSHISASSLFFDRYFRGRQKVTCCFFSSHKSRFDIQQTERAIRPSRPGSTQNRCMNRNVSFDENDVNIAIVAVKFTIHLKDHLRVYSITVVCY
ncbi:hypothetical protein Tcan_01124, partial [Toxocara canis]